MYVVHYAQNSIHLTTYSQAYNVIQWNNMQASHLLAQKAQESAENSLTLTDASLDYAKVTAQEEKLMKIVTLVTLFFLPGTFISVCIPRVEQ